MKKLFSSTILGLVLTTTLLVGSVSVTNAATGDEHQFGFRHAQGEQQVEDLGHFESRDREMTQKNVERVVENIENGIIITATSDDAEVIEKVQKMAEKMGEMNKCESCTRTLEMLENGVQTTITSDDVEMVEELQNRFANGFHGKKGGHWNH